MANLANRSFTLQLRMGEIRSLKVFVTGYELKKTFRKWMEEKNSQWIETVISAEIVRFFLEDSSALNIKLPDEDEELFDDLYKLLKPEYLDYCKNLPHRDKNAPEIVI